MCGQRDQHVPKMGRAWVRGPENWPCRSQGHDGSLGRVPRGSVARIPNTIESQERFKQNSREE